MPITLHILVTSLLVFWLSRTTKIIFYVCLLTHDARQDRQNGNLKNKQNHATNVTKRRKNEVYKNDMSQNIKPHNLKHTSRFVMPDKNRQFLFPYLVPRASCKKKKTFILR